MRGRQHQMAVAVDAVPLALRLTAPEHEYRRSLAAVDNLDDAVRESLPAFSLVRAGLAALYREHGVEQQHTVVCPRLQAAVARDNEAEVIVQFLEDIDQRRRNPDARADREAQPVRLARPMIGILTENHDPNARRGRRVQRI